MRFLPITIIQSQKQLFLIQTHREVVARLDQDEVGRFDLPHPLNPLKFDRSLNDLRSIGAESSLIEDGDGGITLGM